MQERSTQEKIWRDLVEKSIYSRKRRTLQEVVEEPESRFHIESETVSEYNSFFRFMIRHEEDVDKRVQSGEKLEEIFRDMYYSEDFDHPRYNVDQQTRSMQAKYNHDEKDLLRRFNGFAENCKYMSEPPISKGKEKNGWLYFETCGGFKRNERIGRIYFNLRPEHIVRTFEEILPELAKAHIKSQSKIEQDVQSIRQSFNRYDKMVIYFNEGQQAAVWRIIESFHSKYPERFLPETPRFSTPLIDSGKKVMQGVSFAEEPNSDGNSHGTIVGKILAETYSEWKKNKLKPVGVFKAFQQSIIKYGRDPANPAFNDTLQENSFEFIRKYSGRRS